jgi:hypothetical protein
MVTSFDYVPGPVRRSRKELVVLKSAYRQTVSINAIMSGGTFERSFWTETLGRLGLESPGREEAVRQAVEISKQKKEMMAKRQMEKSKRGRKKK